MEQANIQYSQATDADLIHEVTNQNAEALQQVYQRYGSTLRAVIVSVTHDEANAEDILHEVFLQLWNQADRFIPEKGLQGFLVTLARRRALDKVRRRSAYRRATDRFQTELDATTHSEMSTRCYDAEMDDLANLLKGLINQLPPPQQEVIHLAFYQGMSQREIASKRSIALGTVKTRLQLAQKKLHHQLADLHLDYLRN